MTTEGTLDVFNNRTYCHAYTDAVRWINLSKKEVLKIQVASIEDTL